MKVSPSHGLWRCFCFLLVALSPVRRIATMPTEPESDIGFGGLPVPTAAHLDA